jgi:replication-associated recombination protein RarA
MAFEINNGLLSRIRIHRLHAIDRSDVMVNVPQRTDELETCNVLSLSDCHTLVVHP